LNNRQEPSGDRQLHMKPVTIPQQSSKAPSESDKMAHSEHLEGDRFSPTNFPGHVSDIDKDMEKSSLPLDVILDRYGMPLVPQPSRFKDDPLVKELPSLSQCGVRVNLMYRRTGLNGSNGLS
jgi:hypothetical protein